MNNYEINKELINTIVNKLNSYGTRAILQGVDNTHCSFCKKELPYPIQDQQLEDDEIKNYWTLRHKFNRIILECFKLPDDSCSINYILFPESFCLDCSLAEAEYLDYNLKTYSLVKLLDI